MPSPRVALVDTTVLADALLKPGPRAQHARQALARFTETLLPAYAIREFKAGAFRAYLWLHNNFAVSKSYAATLGKVHRLSLGWSRNLVSTALEAMEVASKAALGKTIQQLSTRYGPAANPDAALADRYRFALKRIVYLAWQERRRLTTRVTHELACFTEGELRTEYDRVEVGRYGCNPGVGCSLQTHLRGYLPEIKRLVASDALDGEKPETQKRRKILKEIARKPNREIDPEHCRRIGDAAFVLLAPPGSTILTTNTRDFLPMARVLGKTVESPDQPT